MGKGNSGLSGAKDGGSSVEKMIESRPVADVKVKNAIAKELKELYPLAKVSMTSINTNDSIPEADNGKMVYITADMGTRYQADLDLLKKAFVIMEKYNKQYRFNYMIDKKKFKSDGSNFKDNSKSVYELF